MRLMVISILAGALGTIYQRLGKGTGRIGNQRKNSDHLDCSIVEMS